MEREYLLDVLIGEFLGLEYQAHEEERDDVRFVWSGDESRELLVADVLLRVSEEEWLTPATLPQRPLAVFRAEHGPEAVKLVSPQVPVLYGKRLADGGFWEETESRIRCGVDLLGGAFFLLTRYEEVVKPDRDGRGRFPAEASLAWQEGFLDRPLVNEYLELLWLGLTRVWPEMSPLRRKRTFRAYLTHDVDNPLSAAGRPLSSVLKNAAGDAVRRRDWTMAGQRLRSWFRAARGQFDHDPYNTFDEIMGLSERKGLRSAFFFIADHSGGAIDGDYHLEEPWMRKLMRRIGERGHEIGLHPSYETFCNPAQLKKEFTRLLLAAGCADVAQEQWGGRQHYLRWTAPTTWQAWEEAGLDYDSTLSFADQPGFRCGVCWEYPVFNLITGERLRLRERPLIVMDQTVLHPQYLGMSPLAAQELIHRLRERCRLFDGDFTLLWHNTQLVKPGERQLYRELVESM